MATQEQTEAKSYVIHAVGDPLETTQTPGMAGMIRGSAATPHLGFGETLTAREPGLILWHPLSRLCPANEGATSWQSRSIA